jgi:hypothetical protein
MDNLNNDRPFTAKSSLNLPRMWYSNHFRYQLELLTSFIKLSDEEIKDSKIKYLYGQENIDFDLGEGQAGVITYYEGVDDQTFVLDNIFNEYFPDLKRKSNFIMIISHLEDGLRELCKDLSEEFSVKFISSNKKGIFSAISLFLKSNLKLDFFDVDIDESWKNLKLAYSIRNKIVHLTENKISETDLQIFKISKDFIFSEETNEILFAEIHSFLKKLEIELLKK